MRFIQNVTPILTPKRAPRTGGAPGDPRGRKVIISDLCHEGGNTPSLKARNTLRLRTVAHSGKAVPSKRFIEESPAQPLPILVLIVPKSLRFRNPSFMPSASTGLLQLADHRPSASPDPTALRKPRLGYPSITVRAGVVNGRAHRRGLAATPACRPPTDCP